MPVIDTDVQKLFGVHVPFISTQYRVHDIHAHVSMAVSIIVISVFPVTLVALSVVTGTVSS